MTKTVPYPFQREGVAMMHQKNLRCLLADSTGLGKSLQALLALAERPDLRPAIIVCPASLKLVWEAQAMQHLGMRIDVLSGKGQHGAPWFIQPSVVVINYDILHDWLPALEAIKPKIVVADECFPANTRVLTDQGEMFVADIVERRLPVRVASMDFAQNALVYRPVTGYVKVRRHTRLVTVKHSTGMLVCTEEHEVWTVNRGWIKAVGLQPGDHLRLVRRGKDRGEAAEAQSPKVLLRYLLCDVEDDPTGDQGEGPLARVEGERGGEATGSSEARRFRLDDREQPRQAGRSAGEDPRDEGEERDAACLAWHQGRERAVDEAAIVAAGSAAEDQRRMGTGTADQDRHEAGFGVSYELQGGHRASEEEARGGGGRERAFLGISQGEGCEEGIFAGDSWVEGVEVHEHDDRIKPDGGGEADSFVYCLEVTGTGNFFADGVLVHNCQLLQNPETKRTRAMRRLVAGVKHFIAISATPLTIRPIQLWPVLNMLDPKKWSSRGAYGLRYCLPPDAPILMGNLKEKPIIEVQIGDEVIGWDKPDGKHRRLRKAKVLDIIVKHSKLQEVTLQDGTVLVCTPDHKWHTGEASGSRYEYMPAKMGRLEGRGQGMASKIMRVFNGTKPMFPVDDDYMLGYINGFFRGDGWCSRDRTERTHPFKKRIKWVDTRYRVGAACKDIGPIKRLDAYLDSFSIAHSRKIRSDGLHAIAGMDRKDGYDFVSKAAGPKNCDGWWAGFLGGIYDSEGSGTVISQYKEVNPVTWQMIKEALIRFKIDFVEAEDGLRMRGGRKGFLRFWNIANPNLRRKLIRQIMSQGGRFGGGVSATNGGHAVTSAPRVVSIKPLPGEHAVYTLTTETGNYVAYGCGSKNCAGRRTPWGLDFSRASNTGELHKILARTLMIRRLKQDVLKDLPAKTRSMVPLRLSPSDMRQYKFAEQNLIAWLRLNYGSGVAKRASRVEAMAQVGYLKRLAADLKLPQCVDWIKDFLSTDEKLLVAVVHKSVGAAIHGQFKKEGVRVFGETPAAERQAAFKAFNQKGGKTRLMIANIQAAGTGWSASDCSNVAAMEFPWAPGDMTQIEDRCFGMYRGKEGVPMTAWWMVAQDTIEPSLVSRLIQNQGTLDAVLDGKKVEQFDVFDQFLSDLKGKK